jgi:Tfp pilus assembly protein FimT
MALLSIVIAVASPSLSKFFRGRTLESEARQILSLTRYAQSRAASEGVPMVLWIDVANRTYGLEQDAGYNIDADTKAVSFELDEGLQFEVENNNSRGVQRNAANESVIRFLPDGTISELSVPSITIRQGQDDALWIVQTRTGLNYEIRDQNTIRQIATR